MVIGVDSPPSRAPAAERREAPPPEAAWDALERFGQALPTAAPGEQVRLLLEAVWEGLGADAVFWHSGTEPEAFECLGTLNLSAAWCRAFLEHVLAEGDGGGVLVRSFLDPAAKPMRPWPCSAALVRVSRVAESWLAGLSFHPRRLFAVVDGKVLRLARRMLLNHWQQAQLVAQWQTAGQTTNTAGSISD